MKKGCYLFLIGIALVISQVVYAGVEQDHAKKNDTHDAGMIEISLEGQRAADIQTEVLQAKSLPIYISAPGEVIPNRDLTAIITPRIQSQVLKRLVKIGEYVEINQPLVRLSSVAMAQAQADLLLTKKEKWRYKQLGKQAVSEKYHQNANVAYQQAYAKLLAYGMTRKQIEAFLKSKDPNKANGEFTLLARRGGSIFSADFIEGQMIEPGKVLYTIVDETSLWIDANLSNGESTKIKKGASAIIRTTNDELPAKVLQIHHKLDEITRTRVVRLNVANPGDQLHPGEFVTCLIQTGNTQPVLAVLQTALIRTQDGDEAVYIEVKPEHFRAQEVEVERKIGPWRIIQGLKPGLRIVTQGTFFVHSEALKSGFNTHNH